MATLKIWKSVRIKRYNFFLHLNGFIFLNGCIESDNHNGVIEKCEKRPDEELKESFCSCMASFS